jgi:hypothetical protein
MLPHSPLELAEMCREILRCAFSVWNRRGGEIGDSGDPYHIATSAAVVEEREHRMRPVKTIQATPTASV